MKPVARSRPQFTIFGGPNGSGKSTAYDRFAKAGFDPGEYLNPDEIAKSARHSGAEGSAFDMRAGREVLERTRSLLDAHRSFVRESTLTGREIVRTAERAKAVGYRLVLVFVAVLRTGRSGVVADAIQQATANSFGSPLGSADAPRLRPVAMGPLDYWILQVPAHMPRSPSARTQCQRI